MGYTQTHDTNQRRGDLMRDIVYILKDGTMTEELRYSLRSIEKNFPHRFVWFVGGQPKGLKPDKLLRHTQFGANKWLKIKSSMLEVVKQEELSDEFFLFNDDFFVTKPLEKEFVNFTDRTLTDRIEDFRKENPHLNRYAITLVQTEEELKAQGYGTLNFEVHLPMLFEKNKVEAALCSCFSPQMRSIYGNITGCKVIDRRDVKVNSLNDIPYGMDFVSTNDTTFTYGNVGRYIKDLFKEPSRFEV